MIRKDSTHINWLTIGDYADKMFKKNYEHFTEGMGIIKGSYMSDLEQ